jgi:hypothetical protein
MTARTRPQLGIAILGTPPARATASAQRGAGPASEAADRAASGFDGGGIAIRFAGEDAGRPPLLAMLLDLTLRNPRPEPRWFLVPATCGAGAGSLDGSVHAASVRASDGAGRAVVAHFVGRSCFHAMRLPAGGELHLERLPVEQWSPRPPAVLAFEVVIARHLAIAGEPAERWLGAAVTSDPGARARHDALALVSHRAALDLAELPIDLAGDERVAVRLALA